MDLIPNAGQEPTFRQQTCVTPAVAGGEGPQ